MYICDYSVFAFSMLIDAWGCAEHFFDFSYSELEEFFGLVFFSFLGWGESPLCALATIKPASDDR
jgi:hypothetical protein